jgi:hypothetical protein
MTRFVKDDYDNYELHLGKVVRPVDVGLWMTDYLCNYIPRVKGDQTKCTFSLTGMEDGCAKVNGVIDLHMLGGHILNELKKVME